mgnify:CR=1 FL=1
MDYRGATHCFHPRVQPNLNLYTEAMCLMQRAPSGINSETNVQRNGYMGSHVKPSMNINVAAMVRLLSN